MRNEELTKRYYTISEVAKMFDVSKSLIRFWETEFDALKPYKNSKGDRRFTAQNIDQLKIIYNLVKEKGYTLKGAKQEINNYKFHFEKKERALKSMHKLKGFLENLKNQI